MRGTSGSGEDPLVESPDEKFSWPNKPFCHPNQIKSNQIGKSPGLMDASALRWPSRLRRDGYRKEDRKTIEKGKEDHVFAL